MITKVATKPLDNKGLRPFTVKNTTTLEILTMDRNVEGIKKTFIEGGKFIGTPVKARISKKNPDGTFSAPSEGNGLMVVNEDKSGMWLIPIKNTAPYSEKNIDSAIDSISNEVSEDFDKALLEVKSDKKILGFTYKQLAVIAILMFIARKL
jgi:hypothetical protein